MAPKDVFDVEIVDWYFKEQGFEILSQYARARERLSQNSACHASKRTQVQILLLLKKSQVCSKHSNSSAGDTETRIFQGFTQISIYTK